ncbi:SCO family protein [Mucisphaera sp.]|uniref:SCO family protein n=1 Tax=Mucisphaera sp. TaxID=2913024 RepID=UPI003D100470
MRRRVFLAMGFLMITLAGGMVVIGLMPARGGAAAESDLPVPDPAHGQALDFRAPAFTLMDTEGRAFASSDLDGRVWVVDFIFTRCQLVCPVMTQRMSLLQQRLEEVGLDEVRLVSITVDPEHDTPAVLKAFAEQYGADPERWTFLSGDREKIWRLVQEGFRLALDEDPGNDLMPITHSSRFLVVDRENVVRATFDGLSEASMDSLVPYVGALVAR